MANIVLIEDDPRVLKQIQTFVQEQGNGEHKLRTFNSQKEFEDRYFSQARAKDGEKPPLLKNTSLSSWTSLQGTWLLEHNLATGAPFAGESLKVLFDLQKFTSTIQQDVPDDGKFLDLSKEDFQTKPYSFFKLIPTPFQPVWNEFIKKTQSVKTNEFTFPIKDAGGKFWTIQIKASLQGENLLLEFKDVTPDIDEIHKQEAEKLKEASEDGVDLDLLATIDLIIFKLPLIEKFQEGWLKQTIKSVRDYGFAPDYGNTKFILLKYEDDGIDKVKLLDPRIHDLIYLPLDRVLFLQKLDIILALPQPVQPRFLFQQSVDLDISLAKRTRMDFISDVGFAIRNPIPLKPGLLGHFFFQLGPDQEYEIYAKVQRSVKHPKHKSQYLVYFSFSGIPKTDLTRIRRYLTSNPNFHTFKNEQRENFLFNPDNMFLTDEERRIQNILIIDPDEKSIDDLSKKINQNFDQVRTVGDSSYSNFVRSYFGKKSNKEDADGNPIPTTNLEHVKPATKEDLGSDHHMFFADQKDFTLQGPPYTGSPEQTILGHPAAQVLEFKSDNWIKLLFSQPEDQTQIEEAFSAAKKGRAIEKIFIARMASMEPTAISISFERAITEGQIKVEFKLASIAEFKQKILREAAIETLDAIVIDQGFVTGDPTEWAQYLWAQCKDKGLLPPGKSLSIIVTSHADQPINPQNYSSHFFRGFFQFPLDTKGFFLNLSMCLNNEYTVYNFKNVGWQSIVNTVQVARPVKLSEISEFGATVTSNTPITPGAFLFLRGNIFDNAPKKNLCARFVLAKEDEDNKGTYKNSLLYYGINETFMKFARNWFRETYASSKQASEG